MNYVSVVFVPLSWKKEYFLGINLSTPKLSIGHEPPVVAEVDDIEKRLACNRR